MIIEDMLYDPGTAKNSEDGIIIRLPTIAGVIDGVSGSYTPETGPKFYDKRTGGQMVVDILQTTITTSPIFEPLERTILRANNWIKEKQVKIPRNRSDLLSGACFAITRIGEKEIEIIQTGDCFALWRSVTGDISITTNQIFIHETEFRKKSEELMIKYNGDRTAMWKELMPWEGPLRRKRINNPSDPAMFALLNGQQAIEQCWKKIILPRKDVNLIILFTDGFMYYPDSRNETTLAKDLLNIYYPRGLRGFLEETRKKEDMEIKKSHIDHAEATAIAIRL